MEKTKESWFQKLEKQHPYQTMIYLGMCGSGIIFLFLSISFVFTRPEQMITDTTSLPTEFRLSTIVILVSGYVVSRLNHLLIKERLRDLRFALLSTFILGAVFTGLQFLGWKELLLMGVDFTGLPKGSFLYVLSGIHIFHLIGAMIFALILMYQFLPGENESVKNLILLTNPFEKMRIRLFTVYWIFMDLIWISLFLLFSFAL